MNQGKAWGRKEINSREIVLVRQWVLIEIFLILNYIEPEIVTKGIEPLTFSIIRDAMV